MWRKFFNSKNVFKSKNNIKNMMSGKKIIKKLECWRIKEYEQENVRENFSN